MDIRKLIGIRIAELRKSAGFTQEQLAGKMEISSKYLSSIERGKENPTLNTFINISEALNISLSTVKKHKYAIRGKLGIRNKSGNITTHLDFMD